MSYQTVRGTRSGWEDDETKEQTVTVGNPSGAGRFRIENTGLLRLNEYRLCGIILP